MHASRDDGQPRVGVSGGELSAGRQGELGADAGGQPISGRDAVSVTRCGKNLIDYSQMRDSTHNEVTYTKQPDGGISVTGTASKESFCTPVYYRGTTLPVGAYTPNLIGRKNTSLQIVIERANGKRE